MTDFNLGWRFQKQGAPVWKEVNLPHDAMLYEKRDPNCRNGANSGYFPGGKYVYEKEFYVPVEDLDKNITLLFEAVYQNCRVRLNGKQIGAHKYGYTEFALQLSGKAAAGNNVLTVEVDNSLEPNCRWYSGSGIFRPVHLLITQKEAPELLRVKTVSVSPAVIAVTTEEGNEISVYEGERRILLQKAEKTETLIEILDAKLWNAEHPNLYRCVVSNIHGKKECSFGIRSLTWSAREGLCVNQERVLLRGGCIHHDNGILGACSFADAEERRIRILKEAGYNAIRSAHNPMSRAMLDACDRLGMYVMDECFDGWYTPKTYHDYARYFDTEWRTDLTSMVEKDFNHPCVIFYSVGNEVSETASEKGVHTCGMLREFVHSLDASRPVTAGINVLLNVYTKNGMGVYRDDGKYEAVPLPPKKKGYQEKKTGSAFFNMMAGKLGGLLFYMSAGKKGDKACRGAADNLDIIGLNYAGSRFAPDMKKYPERMMVATETMVTDLPYNWSYITKYPAIIGDFVWAAWDYLGEAAVGDWMYQKYPGLPLLAGSGTVDITGKITAEAYYEQVVWGIRKKPFIGVYPLNHAGEIPKKSSWRFTNAIDSWSWDGYEGKTAVVEVFAAANEVRLELNGRAVGTRKLKKYKTSFRCPYERGTLAAVALDGNGQELARHTLVSAGSQTILSAVPENAQLKADGMSLCFLPVAFTDESGNLKPYIEERLEIKVEGAAELAGFGSALGKTDESYTGTVFHSYRGRALAVIRSGKQAGAATVQIRSEGGLSKVVKLQVI